jgi:hypothetical protein
MLLGAHTRVVSIHPGLTSRWASFLNLNAVTTSLEQERIEYFALRGRSFTTPVVGVSETDRSRVLRALHQLSRESHGYASPVLPRPPTSRSPRSALDAEAWRSLARAEVIRLTWFRTDSSRNLVYGDDHGCEVEFWPRDERLGLDVAPRPNLIAPSLPLNGDSTLVSADRFVGHAAYGREMLPTVRTRSELAVTPMEDVQFPIDVVYTWVDGSDPQWQRQRAEVGGHAYHPEADSPARYINRDELRYSLRSVHMFAPWVRNIYIVTADQTPAWIDLNAPNIKLVSHRDIFSEVGALPTFNSRAIETQLHHIDGLSEHFLYLNDDMFFARPVPPILFFLANGLSKFFLSKNRVPLGSPSSEVTPVQAGAMNNRELIERTFGRTLTRTTLHAPYALRRGVLAEIEQVFPTEHRATMMSRLRDLHTITVASSLHHYYAYYSGQAIPGDLSYGYIRLDIPDLKRHLDRALARRDFDTLCLNDSGSSEDEVEAQNRILLPFLESYFPVASPYEKHD